jgi:hypothetical protein
VIETRKREHSRKPDEQYDLIEACSPGPHLELFARHPRAGWTVTVWGEESDEGVTPRGKIHRGYAGGPLLTPVLAPHQRLRQRSGKWSARLCVLSMSGARVSGIWHCRLDIRSRGCGSC